MKTCPILWLRESAAHRARSADHKKLIVQISKKLVGRCLQVSFNSTIIAAALISMLLCYPVLSVTVSLESRPSTVGLCVLNASA